MKFDRKATTNLTGAQIVAVIIFLLVVFAVTYVAVIGPILTKAPSKFTDRFCKLNNALDNTVTGPAGQAHPVQTWFCPEREVKIEGDDWGACDPDGSKGWEESGDQKSCAQKQIFDYALRCWDMYGRGHWNLGAVNWDYDCFKIKLFDLEGKVDEWSFTQFIRDQDLACGQNFDNNNVCNNNPGCGKYDNIWWEMKAGFDAFSAQCTAPMQSGQTWRIRFHDDVKGDVDQLAFKKA